MVDVVSPADRSRMMAGIQGKNTKPELIVRRMLFASGYRFRLHRRDLPGAAGGGTAAGVSSSLPWVK